MKPIKIVPYDPEWPKRFESEAGKIKEALGNNCIVIHHIGSTSISGLAAKPIIDILAVVKNIIIVDESHSNMHNLGYQIKGEYGFFLRRFFIKNAGFHVHVYEQGNLEIDRHLKFRDWMRTHSDDKQAYEALKKDLAHHFPNDITSYCLGKDTFVAEINEKAGWQGIRVVKPLIDQEWIVIKNYRQKYFFDNVAIQDPYTWTFEHKEHVHFVVYKKSNIIGYAHIQLWPKHRAAIRIIVIDENKRNQTFGSQLIMLIETWLKSQRYKSIHAESSPEALRFYMQHGYIQMPFNDPDGHESSPKDIPMGKLL